jgi:sulfate transport system substrate-binding protein
VLPLPLSRFLVVFTLCTSAFAAVAQDILLNASYDVSRELYKDINPAFTASQGGNVRVSQSHGAASKQVLAVSNGLPADVVTLNQAPDIDALVARGLVKSTWRSEFPHQASPYTTTTVFLVRKGNPKHIQDWSDLARADVKVIMPNPKLSGSGRYAYLAAWGYGLEQYGGAGVRGFMEKLLGNVPVFDGGGRSATTTFTQRGMGDVLVTFENEAILIANELGLKDFDCVYPSLSVDASAPVAVVHKVAERHGYSKLAKAYMDFLFSKEGQALIAKHHFRPRDTEVLAANSAKFPPIKTFRVEEKIGAWPSVLTTHFADGGVFDQITESRP